MKNERGFTLIEMVISLGVIAIIGSLLVSSIVTINANTKTADLMSFLDGFTSEAREVFAANPDKVLNNSFDSADPIFFPYMDMAYQVKNTNEALYVQSFTENLHQATIDAPDEQYRIEISLVVSDQSTAPGFSFQTKKIKMHAKVSEKVNGVLKPEPLYSKEYVFDNVMAGNPAVGEVKKITFQGNGGCIVKSANQTTCLGMSKEKDYYKGSSLYSTGVNGSPIYEGYLENNPFIGWSLGNSDRNLLPNNYKVMNDMSVYAQYLAKNQYRLEFQISGDERFNVAGITGDAVTKPYFIEKTSATKPTINSMENNISRFFVKDAVRKSGYKFDYWEDADGNKISDLNTVMNKQYMILYPHMTAVDNGNQEMLSMNLNLNLDNITAGKNGNGDRLFALYPFTKMEYSLKYNPSDDSFSITQKEIMNKDAQTLTGISKGTVMSTKTFNTKKDGNFYLSVGGKQCTTFTEFVKASLKDPSHVFSISNVKLNVNMPTFTLGDYYTSSTAKDTLRSTTGSTLDKNSATSLFANPSSSAVFGFVNNLPLDAASLTAIDNKVDDLTYGTGTFYNTGAVAFNNSNSTSYVSYTKQGPPTTTNITDNHIKQYNIFITIPLSNLGKMNPNVNPNFPNMAKRKGVYVSNVQVYYDDVSDAYKTIHIRYDLKFGDGSSAVNNPDGSSKVDIYTGIPLIEDQYKKDNKGNELYTYNKIQTVNFTIDGWNGDNGSLDGWGKSDMSDLNLTEESKNIQYTWMDRNGNVTDKGMGEKPTTTWGNTGWFPHEALTGGYKDNYGWMYNNPNFNNTVDTYSFAYLQNRDGKFKTKAALNQWNTTPSLGIPSNNTIAGYWEPKIRPCGFAGWFNPFESDPVHGSWMVWNGPSQISEKCLINNGYNTIPNNPGLGSNFSKELAENGNVSFQIPITTPGVKINVLSFSKPGATKNYLPPFITNMPY